MKKVFRRWMRWSNREFVHATAYSSLDKALEEIDELKIELRHTLSGSDEALDEYADVFMCLLHSMGQFGFTVEDLTEAIRKKTAINQKRKWLFNERKKIYFHEK